MLYPEYESSSVEFKRELPTNDQILKTIIGFCNQHGGTLVIGVDNDRTIVGVPEDELQKVLEYLDKYIFEASAPPIILKIFAQKFGNKTVLNIHVSSGMNKPYFIKFEGLEKGVYIRLGRSTMKATADIVHELSMQSRGISYDMMPVYHATVDDLNIKAVDAFLDKTKRGATISAADMQVLKSYHIVAEEYGKIYPTVAGILCFGNNPQQFFSEAFVICTYFSGIAGREVIATKDCLGTLIDQYHCSLEFITNQLTRSFIIRGGGKRIEQLEIPANAIREMIINALIHRNYYIKAPNKIALYQNRLELFSPGVFPGPLNTHNLKTGLTYIRNVAIAKIFRHLHLIEKLGSGFITLFESYEDRKLKEPQVIEGENYVKVIMPRASQERKTIAEVSDDAKKILALFEVAEEINIKDILEQTYLTRSTIGRRLAELVSEGILKKIGKGKNTRYLRA